MVERASRHNDYARQRSLPTWSAAGRIRLRNKSMSDNSEGSMVSAEKFDLVILGSGSTAFAASLRAQELGKTAVMIEERTIGGTCVNRGCLPSKNLIEAARIIHDARHPRYPGLTPAEIG